MSHEPGPFVWERLPWTETRKCSIPKCGQVAAYELQAEGTWPLLYCLKHTPIHAMPNYGHWIREMAGECSQCLEYEAFLAVLQSNLRYTYTRGWDTADVNANNAWWLLYLDERLPFRSEHGPGREKWRGDLEALREAYHKKRSEEARGLCLSAVCIQEYGSHPAHPQSEAKS